MKKIWILLALVLAVLFFGFREGLETPSRNQRPTESSTATPAAVQKRRAAAAARTPGTRIPPRRANTQNDNIWGPKTTGLGTPRNFGDGDGAGTGRYPTLLGPPRTSSPYMTGVGVVGASQAGVTLPSSASLGSDPLSGFLPFSRQPGDQELVTDPYRVAQSYSPASYSSKNEPVPFLTDFSAFQK